MSFNNNMDYANDLFWSMDGIELPIQQHDNVQENVQFGSLPIQSSKLGHYSPHSYHPPAPQASPITSGSMSSSGHNSTGYTSSSFGSVSGPSQMTFPYVRPTTNLPTRSNLAVKLQQHQNMAVNTILPSTQLVNSPVITDSPHLTNSFSPINPATHFRPPHHHEHHHQAGYGSSLPNIGMRYDSDAELSRILDGMIPSPLIDTMSLSPPGISSPQMGPSTSLGRHGRQSSAGSSVPRSPYPRSTLSPFTPMTIASPLVSTSNGGLNIGSFTDSPLSPSPPSSSSVGTGFSQSQLPAAQRIVEFIHNNPTTAIPAALITSELVEIVEGRGWCLIGNCGADRARQKANPCYDPSKDTATRKRVDHLYDHIRDKHFECRPFHCHQCPRAFSREHDLKRHESVHAPTSYSCGYCPRSYTREDNLKRHVTQRHTGLPTQAMTTRHSLT